MKTYLLRSQTNYGEVVHIVNALDEEDMRSLVADNPYVWDGYTHEVLNTKTRGLKAEAGGDI